jgi:hypothetical protein
LIGTNDLLVASEIGKNRTLVIAVGRDDVPSAALGLQAVLAHEPADLLAVDDKTLAAQLGADPPIASNSSQMTTIFETSATSPTGAAGTS